MTIQRRPGQVSPPRRPEVVPAQPARNLHRERALMLARNYRPAFAATPVENAGGVEIHWSKPGHRAEPPVKAKTWAEMAEALAVARKTWRLS